MNHIDNMFENHIDNMFGKCNATILKITSTIYAKI